MNVNQVHLITLAKEACSYFDDERQSRLVRLVYGSGYGIEETLASPEEKRQLYFNAAKKGILQQVFGNIVTYCPTCRACVPLRVNTDKFYLSDGQIKLMRSTPLRFELRENHNVDPRIMYALYIKYMKHRHAHTSSTMHQWKEDQFLEWFEESPLKLVATRGSQLIGYSLIDGVEDSLALHYSVFEPSAHKLSPGKQLWIATIQAALDMNIPYVYVGTWAQDSPKLDYKKHHKGLETYVDGKWVDFNPEIHTTGPDYRKMFEGDEFSLT